MNEPIRGMAQVRCFEDKVREARSRCLEHKQRRENRCNGTGLKIVRHRGRQKRSVNVVTEDLGKAKRKNGFLCLR